MCEVAGMGVVCFVTYLLQGYRPPAIAEATLVAATTYTSPSPVVASPLCVSRFWAGRFGVGRRAGVSAWKHL